MLKTHLEILLIDGHKFIRLGGLEIMVLKVCIIKTMEHIFTLVVVVLGMLQEVVEMLK
jgi:hypothetical protein